jgi:mono/diheme cytochrome c family protein
MTGISGLKQLMWVLTLMRMKTGRGVAVIGQNLSARPHGLLHEPEAERRRLRVLLLLCGNATIAAAALTCLAIDSSNAFAATDASTATTVAAATETPKLQIQILQEGKPALQVPLVPPSSPAAAVTLKTQSPSYKGKPTKQYRGVDLMAFLRKQQGIDLSRVSELVFVCADGYRARVSMALFKRYKAALAWSEVDAQGKEIPLEPVTRVSGQKVDPGPLFLVWPADSLKDTYPSGWPFAITHIEIASSDSSGAIDPAKLETKKEIPAAVLHGFKVWTQACIACHSLNGVGGKSGPEFNRPMNITTYFARPVLEQFIRDWQTVREARGTEMMPRFTQVLSKDDVSAVVDYLGWMGGR